MKKVIGIIFMFLFSISNAQIQYKFNHFTTDDGLPTNSIYAITEDKKGNIVLGTDNGLTFFDGNDFKTLNVKDGLINPYIVSVLVDEIGHLWFINYNGKLQKLVSNKIVTTSIFTNQANAFLNTKNSLYLYTSQIRYANKTYYYSVINKKNDQVVQPIKGEIKSSRIAPPVLVQDNVEIKFKDNFLIYKRNKVLVSNEISLLHQVVFGENDVFLLDENYLFIEDFNGKTLKKIKLPNPISQNSIYKYDFIIDKQNNCWLNLQNKGLFILKNNKWISINENLRLNTADNINFLFCDSKGKMWIATNEKGLFCIANTAISYYQFPNENNFFNGFASSIDGKSLFVSSKFCLYSYNKSDFNILKKSSSEVKIDNYNSFPVFYLPTKQVTKWDSNINMLLVQGRQLLKYDVKNSVALNGPSAINTNQIQIKSGLKEKIKNVVYYKNEYYFNNSEKITIRTFDEKGFKIKRELKLKIKGYIQDFIFIKDTMWIATEGKVYKSFNEKIVDSISTINNTTVENVIKIKIINDAIFLCSNSGLFVVKNHKNRFLNKYNFLPNNEVYNVSMYGNELFVATKDGLSKIDANLAFSASEKPKLRLFYNQRIVKKIASPAKQELIKIELRIQNFNAVKNQIIQYKIDDLNWVTTQNKFLNFQSLSYGNHSLSVRVKDVNSDWTIRTISIQKEYPFYLKWWFILLMNLFFFGIIYMIYRFQIKRIKAKKQLEIDTNNRVAELRQSALSAMMNPHFVFNSLNAIQYFVNSNQKEKSSEHLAKLSRLVRLFLSQAAEPFISLEDEINRLKLYVELEQTRFENFQFAININSSIDKKSIKIPNMIVQPFIENAILHGVSHLKENDGKIDLNFQLNLNILTIEVIDNGYGIDATRLKSNTHISKGISIITERIEILQESYPEKVFSITQENACQNKLRKGHKVIIVITTFN
jgi:ligand-binding sensor domain-containing protein